MFAGAYVEKAEIFKIVSVLSPLKYRNE